MYYGMHWYRVYDCIILVWATPCAMSNFFPHQTDSSNTIRNNIKVEIYIYLCDLFVSEK